MRVLLCCLPTLLLAADLDRSTPRHFIREGSDLPAFNLVTSAGAAFTSNSLSGKVGVVAFVRPGQKSSMKLLEDLNRFVDELGAETWERVLICSGRVTREEVKFFAGTAGTSATLLLDPQRRAYASFGVVAVPSLAVFDRHSKIVYSRPGYGVNVSEQLTRHLGRLLGKSGETQPADAELYRSTPYIELARRLAEKGDLAKAERLLRLAQARKNPPLEAYLALADVLVRRGQPEEALRHLEKAADTFGRTFRGQISRARVLVALRRTGEAETALREVLRDAPDSWEVHYALGEVYERLDRKDEAIRELKRAVDLLR